MRGSHLHHSDVVAVVQTEQRLGHSHIVVEVALCSHYVVFFSQHGAYQLLGGCLAVGTCDAYDGQLELAAMLTSQVLECLQAVIHEDDAFVRLVFFLVNDGVGTAFLQCLLGKLVAVE